MQLSEEEVAVIEKASLTELEKLRGDIVDNITSIDAQLASHGHDNKNGGFYADNYQEYQAWRAKAVGAKAIKTIQLRAVNKRLHELRRVAYTANRTSSTSFWRGQALNMKNALDVIHSERSLTRVKEVAGNVIEEFEFAIESRAEGLLSDNAID